MPKPNPTSVFLLILWVLATSLVVMVIAPFSGALFAAAVVAGVLYPLQVWTASKLGDRPAIAAGLITAGAVLVVVVPLGLIGFQGGRQLADGFEDVRQTVEQEGVDGAIEKLPEAMRGPAEALVSRLPTGWLPEDAARPREDGGGGGGTGGEASGSESAGASGSISMGAIAAWVGKGLQAAFALTVDIGVLILALYFLLAQGKRLVDWVVAVMPLGDEASTELVQRLRDVNRAVFVATLGSAFIQTLIAGLGFWIAGSPWIPATLLLTFVAALIPVIGGAVIVVAVGVLVWLQGSTGYGIFLVIWGVTAVGLSDNFAKPLIAERGVKLPSSILLFAMLGGLSVFGPMGVVAGPLVIAFFVAILGLMRDQGWVSA